MTFLDLFAGIGGFRKGMELAGHKCVGFCECDKYAVASYTAMHLITDEQKKYLESLPLRQRKKEILKDEYKNGEWYANDIRSVDAGDLPRADCWCFGFPCQDISIAGKQLGLGGTRSSLFFTVTRLIRDTKEEDRPRFLFIENVANLLSVNGGGDLLKIFFELDEIGYDAQWQICNSKDYGVPQNRNRVFIVANLRAAGPAEIFPVTGADGENRIHQIGRYDNDRDNSNAYRVYDTDGVAPTLSTADGGAESQISFIDLTFNNGIKLTDKARALKARDYKGTAGHKAEMSGVAIKIKEATKQGYAIAHEGDSINLTMPESKTRRGRIGGGHGSNTRH